MYNDDIIQKLDSFIQQYYENNYSFDKLNFINIIDKCSEKCNYMQGDRIIKYNHILEEILQAFEREDYYLIMEIMEYELKPIIS